MRNAPNIVELLSGSDSAKIAKSVTEEQRSGLFKVVGYGAQALAFTSNVLRGKMIGCEIEGFLTPFECDVLVEELAKHLVDESYLSGKAKKILESQHNRQSDPDLYFEGAKNHPLLASYTFNAAKFKLLTWLNSAAPNTVVEVARDTNRDAEYCPAIIREFLNSLKLHNDLGSREGQGWNPIEKVNKQWAFVIKLSSCEGGNTFLYNKNWRPEDQAYFNSQDNYSYDMKVVEGVEEFEIAGAKGSLIIFDCTRYHRVQEVLSGRRYSMGGFIGHLENLDKYVIWS